MKSSKKLLINWKLKKTVSIFVSLWPLISGHGQAKDDFPFKINPNSDLTIASINVGLYLLNPVLKSNLSFPTIDDLTAVSRNNLFYLDRISYKRFNKPTERASHFSLLATLSMPAFLAFEAKKSKPLIIMSVMGIETYLTTYSICATLKLLSRRPRPEVYSGSYNPEDYRGIESLNSFPSRHAALAFSAAGFVHSCYSGYFEKTLFSKILLIGSYTAAITSGFLRYHSGVHHLTDVLVGAAIGWSIGYLIPHLHANSPKSSNSINYKIGPGQVCFAVSIY